MTWPRRALPRWSTRPCAREVARLPVIPASVATKDARRATVARLAGRHWHAARYHGARSPWYALLTAAWALLGVVRIVGRLIHWWWVTEQHALRSKAVAAGDSQAWMRLHQEAKETRRVRGFVLLSILAAVVIVAAVAWKAAPRWAWFVLIPAGVVLLSRHGRPADRRIVKPAVV